MERLKTEEIATIYQAFEPGRDPAFDMNERFGQPLDEDALNASYQIVIVADMIDDSTTRIVDYLNERDLAINVLC